MMWQLTVLTLAAGVVIARPVLRAQGGPSAPAAAAARAFPADSVVLAIIEQRVADKRSAGIVVGMLEADGRTRIVAFGDPGPGQPPLDGNSVFEIGSISKVFTATVLSELVKDGRVRLEDPIDKYLPASVHVPERNGLKITLGNLSEQNSGLPRMPNNFRPKDPKNPYVDYGVPQLYDEGADDVGMHLLNPAFPLAPKPTPPKVRTAVTVSRDVLQRYVGTYQLTPQFMLEVTLGESGLQIHPTGQNISDPFPESETEFFFKVVDAQISFVRDAQGAVTGLVLHQNGNDLAARRIH